MWLAGMECGCRYRLWWPIVSACRKKQIQNEYTNAALEAYNWALAQQDQMLDIDVSGLRGRDLKMTAAAFFFNLTGETKFEEAVNTESEVNNRIQKSEIRENGNSSMLLWHISLHPKKSNYPELQIEHEKGDNQPGESRLSR